MLYFLPVPLGSELRYERATRGEKVLQPSANFFKEKGCLFHHHHKLGKAALHGKDEKSRGVKKVRTEGGKERKVIMVVICTIHLLSDTLPSLVVSILH